MNAYVGNERIQVLDTETLLDIYNRLYGKAQRTGSGSESAVQSPVLALVNNEVFELNKSPSEDSVIEFLGLDNTHGFRAYQRSMVFIMIYAVKEICGKMTRVVIQHSINKNYYCEIMEDFSDNGSSEQSRELVTDALLEKIKEKMLEIIEKDIPITKQSLSVENAMKKCQDCGLWDKVKILKYRRTSNVNLYKLDWFYDYFYGPMVPSTGFLKRFALTKKDNGFMLQFPVAESPDELAELKPLDKMAQVFKESADWARILKVETVGELNDIICNGGIGDFIRISEALHEKKIAYIADSISQQNKTLVLIAGPSSSGKTTFANRLCIQLRVNGLKPHVVSLDNYYKNRSDIPLDKYGKPDFECLEALDLAKINEDLQGLMNGQEVLIPTFSFLSGKREGGKKLKLGKDEIIVMEGIHGLNEGISEMVAREQKFKIYISALTQLNVDDHNRISTTDTRLIRRIVRDSRFRGADAARTISMWPSVNRGEVQYIFPFQEEADAFFNSALVYELCVLKYFAEPLLFQVEKDMPEYSEARRLAKFLDSFLSISSEEVPKNSILREFLGGSCFSV